MNWVVYGIQDWSWRFFPREIEGSCEPWIPPCLLFTPDHCVLVLTWIIVLGSCNHDTIVLESKMKLICHFTTCKLIFNYICKRRLRGHKKWRICTDTVYCSNTPTINFSNGDLNYMEQLCFGLAGPQKLRFHR